MSIPDCPPAEGAQPWRRPTRCHPHVLADERNKTPCPQQILEIATTAIISPQTSPQHITYEHVRRSLALQGIGVFNQTNTVNLSSNHQAAEPKPCKICTVGLMQHKVRHHLSYMQTFPNKCTAMKALALADFSRSCGHT
ncbi:hypothetical protein GUJ93_ZPchr0002g24808 [Zizania palustris]|uniref:Uncharacterized protein n=1 Tax=Zizania palustris TaxID=103762 RepID=A0A8J5VFK1_ZIZPA|nr:hypothetical protein GUJ93_ZPchr0002g24808 [Zizania palustris]